MPALSYAHGTSSVPLLGESIGANLWRTVERFGAREALVVRHQNYRATYRQLWEQVGLAARGLLARGVRTRDRVGVWSPNRFEWVVLQYATARIGAILGRSEAPMKPRSSPKPRLTRACAWTSMLLMGRPS